MSVVRLDAELTTYHWGPFSAMLWRGRGGWFRLFGWGLHLDHHTAHRPMFFSERMGLRKKLHISVWPHREPWCIGILRPGQPN